MNHKKTQKMQEHIPTIYTPNTQEFWTTDKDGVQSSS